MNSQATIEEIKADPEKFGLTPLRYNGEDNLAEVWQTSYANFVNPSANTTPTLFGVEIAIGSDYSGNNIQKANYNALYKMAEDDCYEQHSGSLDTALVGVWKVYGGFSTFGIVIAYDCPSEVIWQAIAESADYPLFCENTYEEVWQEAQDSSWESWIKYDFTSALLKKGFDVSDVEDSELQAYFNQSAEDANVYYVDEQVDTAYIDVAEVVNYTLQAHNLDAEHSSLMALPGIKQVETEEAE
jgi:hypothetical protein